MLPIARISDIGIGTGICGAIPHVGVIVSGSGTTMAGGLSLTTMTCIIIDGCQIAVGTIISSSGTGLSGGLGIARISDSFVGTFSGTINSGSGTALCGG